MGAGIVQLTRRRRLVLGVALLVAAGVTTGLIPANRGSTSAAYRRHRAPRPTSGPAPNAQIRFHPPAYAPAGGWAFKTYKNGAGEMCAAEVVPGEGEDATCFARATLFRKTPLLAFLGSRQTGDDITQWDNAWVWGFAEKPITHVQLILTDCTIRDLPVDAEGVYADVEGPATLHAGAWPYKVVGLTAGGHIVATHKVRLGPPGTGQAPAVSARCA
ncbi:MAG TPA: hypothetical protein VE596_03340 [Gaiellaceae bacterium]|jgi:hypothetical protein|nr:hypothetical protein [Gaiellaceae bacterium]